MDYLDFAATTPSRQELLERLHGMKITLEEEQPGGTGQVVPLDHGIVLTLNRRHFPFSPRSMSTRPSVRVARGAAVEG